MEQEPKLLFPEDLEELSMQLDLNWLYMFETDERETARQGKFIFWARVVRSGYLWVELQTRFPGVHIRLLIEDNAKVPRKLFGGYVYFDAEGYFNDSTIWVKTRRPKPVKEDCVKNINQLISRATNPSHKTNS